LVMMSRSVGMGRQKRKSRREKGSAERSNRRGLLDPPSRVGTLATRLQGRATQDSGLDSSRPGGDREDASATVSPFAPEGRRPRNSHREAASKPLRKRLGRLRHHTPPENLGCRCGSWDRCCCGRKRGNSSHDYASRHREPRGALRPNTLPHLWCHIVSDGTACASPSET
jgi:hypothetical protein